MDVRVVRVPARPVGTDEDGLGHASGEQVAHQLRLLLFERSDRGVARQECLGHLEQVGSSANQGLQRCRDVEHQRGV